MRQSPFTPQFAALPPDIGVFPLSGAMCLPGQSLPLNIFEPRYLALVDNAFEAGRMFAMIQPRPGGDSSEAVGDLYGVGCACRIAAFQETDDGRYIIQLSGVCRFDVAGEVEESRGFRRIVADWSRFEADLKPAAESPVALEDLRESLDAFAAAQSLDIEWEGVEKVPGAHLVDVLSVSLPFGVEEKQALLEAPTVIERVDVLRSALAMGAAAVGTDAAPVRH